LTENHGFSSVAPDGQRIFDFEKGAWKVRSLEEDKATPIPGIAADELVIAWAADGKHVFMQATSASGLTIYKIDVESGKKELWQTINPKDQVGLRPMSIPSGITPDGRWIAFNYRTQVGQLYRSDNLK
jgi:Tol biopolymer transport system component